MKKAMLWQKINSAVQCNLCARRCKIPKNGLGFCLVRKNIDGILYTLNYGKIISMNADPMEKKPLFHFYPGSFAFSIASPGCNFACKFCQNWEISQVFREGTQEVVGLDYTPEQIVNYALKNNCKAISYTYTEPTIFFEFAYDTAKLAVKKGLKNTFVTNGYMTIEALKKISKYLHAASVDFKCSGNASYYLKLASVPRVEPIYETLIEMKKRKIHIEITDLLIPKYNKMQDLEKLVVWIEENLGKDTPFHILRFFPHYKLTDVPPTSLELLNKAYEIASKHLNFVYIGNLPGYKEDTVCPGCKTTVVKRYGFYLIENKLKKGKCPECGYKIAIS